MISSNKKQYTGELVKKTEFDGIIVSTSNYSSKDKEYDWHFHKNPHISFTFQGDYTEASRCKKKESVTGVSFYHAGETHLWSPLSSITKSANVHFDVEFMRKYEFNESRICDAVNSNFNAIFLILKIQKEMFLDGKNSPLAIQTLLLELFSESNSIDSSSFPKWVLVLYDLLNDRWNEKFTLDELALETNVHPTTISKYFRKYFTCTFSEYLRKLKINNSISLVKDSNLTLTEIAFQCGFTDQSHFTRTFKQMTGFLPRDFRNF